MTRLHFQPIKGKTLDIIDAILQTEEVASAGDTPDSIIRRSSSGNWRRG